MTPHKSIRTAIAAAGTFAFFMSAVASFAAAPDAPKDVRAESVAGSSDSIRVTWTAPDNATQTTSYEVRWQRWPSLSGWKTLNVGGVTQHTLADLFVGTMYKVQVRTMEVGGEASAFAPETAPLALAGNPPGAPKGVRAEPVAGSSGSILVTWSAPDNATQTTSYEVRWWRWSLGSLDSETLNVGGVTRHTLTGLRVGKSYRVQVRAMEVGGEASAFAPKSSLLAEAGGNTPGAPKDVRAEAVAGSPGSIRVTWGAPDNATQTTSYEVHWDLGWGRSLNVGGVTAHTLTGLRAGKIYRVQVRAMKAGGDASDYAPDRPLDVEADTPVKTLVAPENVRATRTGTTAHRLSWSAPDGGPRPTEYKVRMKPVIEGGPDWQCCHFTGGNYLAGDTSDGAYVVLTYLAPLSWPLKVGETYRVQVAAMYESGRSEWAPATPLSFTPTAELPAPPTLIDDTSHGYQSLEIYWQAEEKASPNTAYRIRWKPRDKADDWEQVDVSAHWRTGAGHRKEGYWRNGYWVPSIRKHTLTGLDGGTKYEIQVASVNAEGQSEFSNAIFARPGEVTEPRNVRVASADRALHVAWQAPANGVARSYRVLWRGAKWNSRAPWNSHYTKDLSYTISGLQNGAAYAVKIEARGPSGLSSPYSETKTGKTTSPFVPPENLRVNMAGDGKLGAQWDAPPSAHTFTGYKLRWRKADETKFTEAEFTAGKRSHTIKALQARTTYKVSVATVNGDAISAYSPEIEGTTGDAFVSLDINIDGRVTAADGILLYRYLLGVRGKALIAGQTDLTDFTDVLSAEKAAEIIEESLKLTINDGNVRMRDENGAPVWRDGKKVAKLLIAGTLGDNDKGKDKDEDKKLQKEIRALSTQ